MPTMENSLMQFYIYNDSNEKYKITINDDTSLSIHVESFSGLTFDDKVNKLIKINLKLLAIFGFYSNNHKFLDVLELFYKKFSEVIHHKRTKNEDRD